MSVANMQLDFMLPPKIERSQNRRVVSIMGRRLTTTPVFDAYWYFAAERQRIFFRRLARSNRLTFTDDPILAEHKFTNAYRASDRVSQFLIREVIYGEGAASDPENVFFRIMLFKLFNKVETWRALESHFGTIEVGTFDFDEADRLLSQRQQSGLRNYSAAYIMPSCGRRFDTQVKHTGHLRLLEELLLNRFPSRLLDCNSMGEAFSLLQGVPSLGRFLAYQFATDLNYSEIVDFSEMEFVVAGPGAIDGISKCFEHTNDLAAEEIIAFMADNQEQFFSEVGEPFPSLWGRPLQLIDCQNLFCEISKYARMAFPHIGGVSGRTRIKQKFRYGGPIEAPFYPPAWGLNEKVTQDLEPRAVYS